MVNEKEHIQIVYINQFWTTSVRFPWMWLWIDDGERDSMNKYCP